jgi:hypothetical protein
MDIFNPKHMVQLRKPYDFYGRQVVYIFPNNWVVSVIPEQGRKMGDDGDYEALAINGKDRMAGRRGNQIRFSHEKGIEAFLKRVKKRKKLLGDKQYVWGHSERVRFVKEDGSSVRSTGEERYYSGVEG